MAITECRWSSSADALGPAVTASLTIGSHIGGGQGETNYRKHLTT
jgi:hypothetical protein